MTGQVHAVLGGNGVVGRETVRALLGRGLPVRSVGRRPSALAPAESVIADLLDADAVVAALDGAGVAYLVAGLPYSSAVWRAQWPTIVAHAAAAASARGIRLVYLDNVYAYGAVSGPMTESTPLAPRSAKGEVRAQALRTLYAAAERGLDLVVGRSADFYGIDAPTSVVNRFVVDRIAARQRPMWLYDADLPHSLTWVPDIADGLAVLGADPRAAGRVWHLPTAPPLTGREYVEAAAGRGARLAVMGGLTMRLGALFDTAARETHEMRYQYSVPYVLDSSLFESTFGVEPTPVAEAMRAALAAATGRRQA
ncbi:NAD-dependent epimerase/dehydratase family protein [Microbacterium sp. NPDC089320]|uniref:NAD-dependent epimerase/dehydratase family protein n=1 Tax=Microbacterium sp. NPDC089320 TaxID=3155182 RepID=UPI0034371472